MWTLAAIALVWLAVGRHLVPGSGCSGRRRLSGMERRQLREIRRDRRWRRRHGWTEAHDAAWEGRGARRELPPVKEDPVARLQRLWVNDRISDSEYERSLDEVYAGRLKLV